MSILSVVDDALAGAEMAADVLDTLGVTPSGDDVSSDEMGGLEVPEGIPDFFPTFEDFGPATGTAGPGTRAEETPAYRRLDGDTQKVEDAQKALDDFMSLTEYLPERQIATLLSPVLGALGGAVMDFLLPRLRGDTDTEGPNHSDLIQQDAVACGYLMEELPAPNKKALAAWWCGLRTPVGLGSNAAENAFMTIYLSHGPKPHDCGCHAS